MTPAAYRKVSDRMKSLTTVLNNIQIGVKDGMMRLGNYIKDQHSNNKNGVPRAVYEGSEISGDVKTLSNGTKMALDPKDLIGKKTEMGAEITQDNYLTYAKTIDRDTTTIANES